MDGNGDPGIEADIALSTDGGMLAGGNEEPAGAAEGPRGQEEFDMAALGLDTVTELPDVQGACLSCHHPSHANGEHLL